MSSRKEAVQELLSENTHRAAAPPSMLSAKLLSFCLPHLKQPGPRVGIQDAIIGQEGLRDGTHACRQHHAKPCCAAVDLLESGTPHLRGMCNGRTHERPAGCEDDQLRQLFLKVHHPLVTPLCKVRLAYTIPVSVSKSCDLCIPSCVRVLP